MAQKPHHSSHSYLKIIRQFIRAAVKWVKYCCGYYKYDFERNSRCCARSFREKIK